MSNLTRRAMAQAITDLLKTESLDRITIRDITDQCGLTRNTFYYHFHDVYDLLSWLFHDKTDQIMAKYTREEDWGGGLEEVLCFLHENKSMINHVYKSISYDALDTFVNDIVYHHVEVVVATKARDLEVSQEAITLTSSFYMNAVVGSILSWIRDGMPESPERLAQIYNALFLGTVEDALSSAQSVYSKG